MSYVMLCTCNLHDKHIVQVQGLILNGDTLYSNRGENHTTPICCHNNEHSRLFIKQTLSSKVM